MKLLPLLEPMEPRTLLSTIAWANNAGGSWDDPTQWVGGTIPGPSDDAVISYAGITVTASGSDSANSLNSQADIRLSGGSLTVATPSTINGKLEVSGGSSVNGTITVAGQFTVDPNSSLGGTGLLTSTGLFTLGGNLGTISVPSIDAQGGAVLQAVNTSYLDGTALTLHGASTFVAGGAYQLKNGASITNLGTVTANIASSLFEIYGAGTFTNQGTITKTGGGELDLFGTTAVNAGSINVQGGDFETGGTNSGTVTIQNGASLYASPYVQTAGATILNGGTINGGPLNINSGSLVGNGTINANVTNSGHAIPGGIGTIGLLTISGSYAQGSSGSLEIELSASGSDRLTVSGSAALGGTINIAEIGGYVPAIGATFQPLTFGSSSGDFATYNGLKLGHCEVIAHALNPTNLTLTVQAEPPPVVGPISGPTAPVLSAATVAFSAPFSQVDTSETHTAVWSRGDSTTSVGVVTEVNAAGTVTGSHAYAFPGSYTVTLTVKDSGTCSGQSTFQVTVIPSILVLDKTASGALSLSGNASINITGTVLVDSSSATAVSARGNAKVTSAGLSIVGGDRVSGNASLGSPVTTGSAYTADPLAGLALPAAGAPLGSVNLSGNATLTIGPGVYSQIKVSGNAKLTMQPGVYEIAGGGFTVSGNAGVSGPGVTIYNAGSSFPAAGGNFGGISLSGNGVVALTAPSTGTYAGVAIFQSRDNTRALALSGNGMAGMKGIVYAPSALLALSGNGQESLPLIVDQLVMSGNASSTLAADGTASSSAIVPGQLLAGDIMLAVDDPNGLLSTDALARVSDAVASLNALLAPYSVTVTLLAASEVGLANVVFDTSATTPLGGAAQGVLGCETDTATVKEITLVQGWDWYAGADPSAIGAGQYDFETALVHELGHALGLGHSPSASSVMFASLATGAARRSLAVPDLNIPDSDKGPCGLRAESLPRAATDQDDAEDTTARASDLAASIELAASSAKPDGSAVTLVVAVPRASRGAISAPWRSPVRVVAPRLDGRAVDTLLGDRHAGSIFDVESFLIGGGKAKRHVTSANKVG